MSNMVARKTHSIYMGWLRNPETHASCENESRRKEVSQNLLKK